MTSPITPEGSSTPESSLPKLPLMPETMQPETRDALAKIMAALNMTPEEAATAEARESREALELDNTVKELVRDLMGRITAPYEEIEPQGLERDSHRDHEGGRAVTLYSPDHDVTIIVEATARRIAPKELSEIPSEHWVYDPNVTAEDIIGLQHRFNATFFRGKHAPQREGFYGTAKVYEDEVPSVGQIWLDTLSQSSEGDRKMDLFTWCLPEGSQHGLRGVKPEVVRTLTEWCRRLEVLEPQSQLSGAVGELALEQTIDRPNVYISWR